VPGDVCPKCGVAVVPGYIRCPKCHASLPHRPTPQGIHVGGTSIEGRGFRLGPLLIVAGVLGLAIVLYFALRSRGGETAKDSVPATAPAAPSTVAELPTGEVTAAAPASAGSAQPAGARADDIGAQLERTLKHMHLWATVEVGSRTVDVRSSSCSDPAMKPMLDSAGPRFRAAGLTRLRCLEQSGAVVFTRDL